jgi:hypothetical protein
MIQEISYEESNRIFNRSFLSHVRIDLHRRGGTQMKFASEKAAKNFDKMLPRTQELAKEMDQWTQEHFGFELTLTETWCPDEDNKALHRISVTHTDGRAFDVRTRDTSEDFQAQFCAYFRKKYPTLGAIRDNQSRLIVAEPHGSGPHFHIQIKKGA